MRLGIVVVYLVPEGHEELLALHLRQIEKHTNLPYTIFGCATRLSSRAHAMLAAGARVVLCACPPAPTDALPTPEHAHYLEHLTRAAFEAGMTHVVTLHVDSFPVASYWVERLAGHLSERSAVVAPDKTYTACMMFTRAFHVDCAPSFLVAEPERSSGDYAAFLAACRPAQHSGTGYLFRAFQHGYSASMLLPRVLPRESEHPGELYDDAVFHLGSAAYLGKPASGPSARRAVSPSWARWAAQLAQRVFPPAARSAIRDRLRLKPDGALLAANSELLRQRTRRGLATLLADPDGYVDRLRNATGR